MPETVTPNSPANESIHRFVPNSELADIEKSADEIRDASLDEFSAAADRELGLSGVATTAPPESVPPAPISLHAGVDTVMPSPTPVLTSDAPGGLPANNATGDIAVPPAIEDKTGDTAPVISRLNLSPSPDHDAERSAEPSVGTFGSDPKPDVVINDDGERIMESVGTPSQIALESEITDADISAQYGMTRAEYQERLARRERMTPGEKGWLTREKHQLEAYLQYLESEGGDLPGEVALVQDRMEARLQDLSFVLDNDREFEDGLTGEHTNKMHHLPMPATEPMRGYIAPRVITANATEPAPGEPAPGEPAPGEPAPGEPAPGEPAPGEPAPGEPAPGEPAPGEPAPGEPAPGEHSLEVPLVAHIADTEVADRRKARILADHQVNAELAELRQEIYGADAAAGGNVFSRMTKSVARAVKGTVLHPVKSMEYVARSTMLREGYRQKYIYQKFGDMQGADFHSVVANEVARRLDLGEDLLMDGENILGEDRPEVRAVKDQLNAIFHEGLTGARDRASVLEEAKRIAAAASWINNSGDQGPHLIQNLETIYDRVIAQVDHEAGLAAVDEAYKLEGGTAELDVNAEAHRTRVDAIMEKYTGSHLKGYLVNEATVAIAVGAVTSFVGNFLKSGSVRKGAVLLGLVSTGGFSLPVALAAGAAAGGFAALRERMTLRQERALHMADIATGSEMPGGPEGAPRRAEIDATIVEMASVGDLLQRFDELQPEDGLELSPGDAQELANWLVHTTTLQQLGDSRGIDLIRYSSPDSLEAEKTDLFVARAQAIAMVRNYGMANPSFLAAAPGSTIDEKIAAQVQMAQQAIVEGELSQKDKTFRSLTRKRGAQRAVATAAFSVFASFLGSKVTDQIRGGHEASSVTHHSVEPNTRVGMSMRGDAVNIPKGWHADGKQLFDAKGNVVLDHFTGSGTGKGGLSPESIAAIRAKGYGFHEKVDWHRTTVVRQVSAPGYIAYHPEQFKVIHRTGWMDNNTPAPKFDLNELRLDFHARPDGSVVLASDRMFNAGSFHDQLAIMAHSQQAGGHLRMLITPSRADQSHAMVLDIQPNGEVVLPPWSPARSFFDIQPNGKVDFKGGFVEVGYPSSIRPDGSNGYFILATSPGSDHPVTIPTIEHVDYAVTTATITVPKVTTEHIASTVWKAPFLPVAVPLPRRPLEELIPPSPSPIRPPEYYYGAGGLESARRWLRGRERMHRPYREVSFVEGGESRTKWVDENGDEVKRDVSRENATIDDYLSEVRMSDPGYYTYLESLSERTTLPSMDDACRVSVNIPAWMEGRNIYRLLSQYVNQTNTDGSLVDPSTFEINIIVNRKTGTDGDNSVEEIERFIAEMRATGREYRINYIDVEFDPPLNNVGHARKVITDLTLMRSRQRSSQAGSLYIESEDADLLTVDPHVISNVVAGFDQRQHVDVLRGRRNDRLPGLMMENDVLFASRRMWDFTERLLRKRRYRPDVNSEKWSYQWNRVYSNGWGTAYTAEAYAMIGGYDSHQTKGEDMLIGERITMLRGEGDIPNTEVVGIVNNHSSSSPRRFVREVTTGRPAYSDDFENEAVNEEIRNSSLGGMITALSDFDRLSKPAAQSKMNGITAGYWEFIYDNTPNEAEAKIVFSRLMTFMGFKKDDYQFTPGGGVKVVNYTNVAAALQRYRDNPPRRVVEEYEQVREAIQSGAL